MRYMDSYITWPYLIADLYCRITWVYNKYIYDSFSFRKAISLFINTDLPLKLSKKEVPLATCPSVWAPDNV